jgi:hypothetical protein
MDETAALQLRLIRELAAALDPLGVRWWLFGGWAVDFNLGHISRKHDDIEAFILERDAPVVRAALTAAGFAAPTPLHPDEGQPFLKEGQELGLWFLNPGEDGRLRMHGRWADWPLPTDSFEGTALALEGAMAFAVSPLCLIEMKLNFQRYAPGAETRNKDSADIEALRELIAKRES